MLIIVITNSHATIALIWYPPRTVVFYYSNIDKQTKTLSWFSLSGSASLLKTAIDGWIMDRHLRNDFNKVIGTCHSLSLRQCYPSFLVSTLKKSSEKTTGEKQRNFTASSHVHSREEWKKHP